MFLHRIDVALDERAFVTFNERPVRYLRPGRHWVLSLWPFRKVRVERVKTDSLVTKLRAEHLELVPLEDLRVVRLGETERAVLVLRGRAARWLGAGEHHVWTVERSVLRDRDGTANVVPAVDVRVLDVSGLLARPLADDVKPLAPASDYLELTVPAGAVGLRWVDGALDEVLPAGRHAAWTVARKVNMTTVDLRERILAVTGQEVMTKDHVSLRLNLSATFRVADPRRLATVAREPDDVLYLAMQVAGREAVASRTLDELLAAREALSEAMASMVVERARGVGLDLLTFALKDMVLPGEMRSLLNRVIEARKEAEANVILRREETAAARSLAQTARVLSENPLMVRLKELEAYRDLASKVGQVHVVLGDGAMKALELKVGG